MASKEVRKQQFMLHLLCDYKHKDICRIDYCTAKYPPKEFAFIRNNKVYITLQHPDYRMVIFVMEVFHVKKHDRELIKFHFPKVPIL